MPTNDYNVGRDITLDLNHPTRGILRFPIRTSFNAQPQFVKLQSKGLDGVSRFAAVPNGWQLRFGFDRASPELDDYFATQEDNYFRGRVDPLLSITESIRELNLSVSQFRYTGVSLTLENAGDWKGDAIVTQALEAMASRRLKVA